LMTGACKCKLGARMGKEGRKGGRSRGSNQKKDSEKA